MRRASLLLLLLVAACRTGNLREGSSRPSITPSLSPSVAHTAIPTPGTTPNAKEPGPPANAQRAHVTRVIDGDTIVLAGIRLGSQDARTGGRRARLIGIDTPEVYGGVECLGREASAFTKRTLGDADVLVAFDVDPIDRYGRALVYVWQTDGTFFNARIVEEGFATPMTVPPNVRYADLFVRLAEGARARQAGLWRACLAVGREPSSVSASNAGG